LGEGSIAVGEESEYTGIGNRGGIVAQRYMLSLSIEALRSLGYDRHCDQHQEH